MTYIYLAVEDKLSETVGERLLREHFGADVSITVLSGGGFGYLKKSARKFAEIAKRNVVLLITDLDTAQCAPTLRNSWLAGMDIAETFVFRVAVREIEAWVMADVAAFAAFLKVSPAKIRSDVEAIHDPKAELIRLGRSAPREIRAELVPSAGVRAMVGLGYNAILANFVRNSWSPARASENSNSLSRARSRLEELAHSLGDKK